MPVLQVMHYSGSSANRAPLADAQGPGPRVPPRTHHPQMGEPSGLEPRTLQFLICEAHQRLKGQEAAQPAERTECTSQDSQAANARMRTVMMNNDTRRQIAVDRATRRLR